MPDNVSNLTGRQRPPSVKGHPIGPRSGRAARLPTTPPCRRGTARGMTTIEYALGILCAAAIALTLLRIVNDESFFQAMKDWVMGLVGSLTKG